jgi:hypothetical protein
MVQIADFRKQPVSKQMAFELKIDVVELRTVVNRILDHIEHDLGKREVITKTRLLLGCAG